MYLKEASHSTLYITWSCSHYKITYISAYLWKISGMSAEQLTVFSLEMKLENFTFEVVFSIKCAYLILIIKTRKLIMHMYIPIPAMSSAIKTIARNQGLNPLISAQCSVFVYGMKCLRTWYWGRYLMLCIPEVLGGQTCSYTFNVGSYPKHVPLPTDIANSLLKRLLIHFYF